MDVPLEHVGGVRPVRPSELTDGWTASVHDSVYDVAALPVDPALGSIVQPLRELGRVEYAWKAAGVPVSYLVVDRGRGTAAVVPLFRSSDRHYAGWRPEHLFRDRAGGPGWERGVLVGSDATTPNVANGWPDPHAVTVALRAAVDMAETASPGFVCVPHLADGRDEALAEERRRGPVLRAERPELVLDLPFSTFEGYLASLPKRRRRETRVERRRFLDGALRVDETPPGEVLDELAPLLRQVDAKYGPAPSLLDERNYLQGMAMAMAGAGRALVARDGGRAVAFALLWCAGEEWRIRCWGADYSHPAVRADAAYFNLVFYEPVIRATAAGARRLVLGTGTAEAKTLRGARPRRLGSLAWRTSE